MTKKKFNLLVKKSYTGRGVTAQIDGNMVIEAENEEEARENFFRMLTQEGLQTNDSRIDWNWGDCALTEEEVVAKGLDYDDFSFGIDDCEYAIVEKESE